MRLFELFSLLYGLFHRLSCVFTTGGAGITGKSSWRSNQMSTTVWLEETWWSPIPSTRSTPARTRAWPRTSTAPSSAKRPGSSLDVSTDPTAKPMKPFETNFRKICWSDVICVKSLASLFYFSSYSYGRVSWWGERTSVCEGRTGGRSVVCSSKSLAS